MARPAVLHSTVIAPKAATQAGALSGFTITCTCGTVLTTSLSKRQAVADEQKHLEWHDRTGR